MSTDRQYAVLTALGTDRPGIVDRLSQVILEAGGNIEASQMGVLGGEFALMVLVSGPGRAVEALEQALARVESELGLHTLLKRTAAPGGRAPQAALAYRLRATCLDHPGIVNRVSHLLAEQGVNIERAECAARPGPWSGAPIFNLEMTLAVPDQAGVKRLREALGQLGADEGIDIELHAET